MNNPKLEVTKNYDLFDMHQFNRPVHEDAVLEESMKRYGFMPSSPIQCKRNGNATLKIIRGHHRFHYAKRLGLPVYYVIDESNCDIFDLEAGKQGWNIYDFARARAMSGNADFQKLLDFRDKHHLTLGAAASLMGGQSAGSTNKKKAIKNGKFCLGDLRHANEVVTVTDACRESGVSFATSSAFVAAISSALRVPEFNRNQFVHKVRLWGANLRKRGTAQEFLQEIEALYNYGNKKPIPLAFRAKEIQAKRALTFGREQ